MSFTDAEIEFIRAQGLGRLASVDPDGQPDVVPVAVEFDGRHFWVGGPGDVVRTRKFRNVARGAARVSIVFDDLPSMEPFVARGLRVYGEAEQPFERTGMVGPGTYMRITPPGLVELESRRRTGGRRVVSGDPPRARGLTADNDA